MIILRPNNRRELRKIRLGWRFVVAALIILLSVQSLVQAAPPEMPKSFDRDTVQHLLTTVDEGHNAAILKFGYFMKGGTPALPLGEGYGLLKAAINTTPEATKRWFILRGIQGFSALRVKTIPINDGFDAYDAVFEQADKANNVDMGYNLQQTTQEYVAAVLSRFGESDSLKYPRIVTTLTKAWECYSFYSSEMKNPKLEPPWIQAIDKLSIGDQFINVMEKTLKDPNVTKTYWLLKEPAGVYAPLNSVRAIEILQHAKPFLPKKEMEEVQWYYDTLVDLLIENDRLPEAISAREEAIRLTGHGQGKLLVLHLLNGNLEASDKILITLQEASASELETNVAAQLLSQIYRDEDKNDVLRNEAGERIVTLLSSYLKAERKRSVEMELGARQILGDTLIRQGKLEKALAALNVEHIKAPLPTARARSRYRMILTMAAELNSFIKRTKKQEKKQ